MCIITDINRNKLFKVQTLYKYWDDLKGDLEYPLIENINHEELQELWKHCLMVHCHDGDRGNTNIHFQHVGDYIKSSYERTLDMYYDSPPLISPNAEMSSHIIESLQESREPFIEESVVMYAKNHTITYNQCLLPLTSKKNPGAITAIIGALEYKTL